LLAGVLSFASPKESSQRKGDPRVGALRVPCATRRSGRLAKLACGSDNASRQPPARLRCSAPLMGTPKASVLDRLAEKEDFHGQPEKTAKNEICQTAVRTPTPSLPRKRESTPSLDSRLARREAESRVCRGRGNDCTQAQTRVVSPGPLRGAEQRRGWRIKGEDCLRAKPEFRSPRQSRVAQGTGAAGTDPGSPSFCLLFLGEARRKYARQQGGTPSQLTGQPPARQNQPRSHGQPEILPKFQKIPNRYQLTRNKVLDGIGNPPLDSFPFGHAR